MGKKENVCNVLVYCRGITPPVWCSHLCRRLQHNERSGHDAQLHRKVWDIRCMDDDMFVYTGNLSNKYKGARPWTCIHSGENWRHDLAIRYHVWFAYPMGTPCRVWFVCGTGDGLIDMVTRNNRERVTQYSGGCQETLYS